MNQEIIEFLASTTHITDENNEKIMRFADELIEDRANFFPLAEIAVGHTDMSIKHAATIYINKIIDKINNFWDEIDQSEQNQFLNSFISILQSNLSPSALHTLLHSIIILYANVNCEWPDLINLILEMLNSDRIKTGLKILNSIFVIINDATYAQISSNFLNIAFNSLNSPDIELQFQGSDLLANCVKKHQGEEIDYSEHVKLMLNLVLNSEKLHHDEFCEFWENVKLLVFLQIFTPEQVLEIAKFVFTLASDEDMSPDIISMPLRSLIPALDSLGEEAASKLLEISIDICARTIKLDNEIPVDQLKELEDSFHSYSHQEIYPIIRTIVLEKLSSEDVSQQIASLLVFSVILTEAKDCAFADIQPILEFIDSAISSENPLLQQAALTCINKFDDSFASINVHGMHFLSQVISLCASPVSAIRDVAYQAAETVLNPSDHKIPGLFADVVKLLETLDTVAEGEEGDAQNITETKWSSFLSLLAPTINLSEEFEDEQVDEILGLVENIMSEHGDNPSFLMPLLDIGVALIRRDETQAEYILEMLNPAVSLLLKDESQARNIFHADYFLKNIALTIGDASSEFISPFLETLISRLQININELILSGSLESLAQFVISCPSLKETVLEPLLKVIVPAFSEDDGEEGIVPTTAMATARALKKDFPADVQLLVFQKVVDIAVEDTDDADDVGDAFLTISKIIKYLHEENKEQIIGKCIEITNSIINATLPFLHGQQLIEIPSFAIVARPIEHFLAAVLRYPVPESDAICKFLLEWPIESTEFEADDITGAYTEAIKTGVISDDIREGIFQSVNQMFQNCQDPGVQQNLVFFLNTILRANHSVIEQILQFLPVIDEWYNIGKNQIYGYQDTLANIASLYLEIAAAMPDFPDQQLIQAIDEFPPSDVLETPMMAKCLLTIVPRLNNADILGHVALALARFVVWDDKNIEKSKIDQSLKDQLYGLFKQIVQQNESLMGVLQNDYAKQRAKMRRLQAVLN
ncbi:hypothetical protein TVAG_342770 [Trichomonas vaginalis G3]|uniref:Importin N-terminal domain-containing protein n=1 Tax=Trichomonas vaginalis (strain ATCC PRA-98 / G3) TaxID=412133 RepID=A2EJN9_TRIV3|nr:armadillo (ARM) repeat-containing protein family [Trichomonas vaginalis G3]EAY07113.1 hypothetical protein TVAG_342770 [Trichomonas vaginalis G3]KAI5522468.1 armadillo (ARM) repeat-containing protein family [Trichomonas vaginalis G3]|eukprot:XP_001319336.1 hypothetical protein [Trichomonas vaginalis G3]